MAACRRALFAVIALVLLLPRGVLGQAPPDPAQTLAAQREAMTALRFMDGVWRGPAWTIFASGVKQQVTQTERIGPFLDGTVKVIEGRGYGEDGKVAFNALAIISYDPGTKTYSMRSYARGMQGDFALVPSADGYVWEIPAGPATIRYTATIKDGTWHEVGERIAAGKAPVRIFEMNLTRVGETDWPAAGAVGAK
jgi:hypothetical protein